MPERRFEPDAVRAAAEATGSIVGAARLLGTSRQLIHARTDLRRAAMEGIAAYRSAQLPAPGTAVFALRLRAEDALALTDAARIARMSRQAYLGLRLASLATLPEPVAADHGDATVRIGVPIAWHRRMLKRYDDEYPARVRAALMKVARP